VEVLEVMFIADSRAFFWPICKRFGQKGFDRFRALLAGVKSVEMGESVSNGLCLIDRRKLCCRSSVW
jgi:hypothetical protein